MVIKSNEILPYKSAIYKLLVKNVFFSSVIDMSYFPFKRSMVYYMGLVMRKTSGFVTM